MWINHLGQNLMSGGQPSYYSSGGKSVPRYSSLCFELSMIEKLREGEGKDPYGFVTRVQLTKNRLGPNWRYVDLYYIFGEGFSKDYDYFTLALKQGLIRKNGGWFYIPGEGSNEEERKKSAPWKLQGELKSYKDLSKNPNVAEIWKNIKAEIDGIEPEVNVGPVDETIPKELEED